ncbi:S-layer homology domain-containing protein [Candidatus Peregrinibacteria bacterium]|nr:S-layer homology domain-containing protein [Candidatus Peregrinibacteria bacterium]
MQTSITKSVTKAILAAILASIFQLTAFAGGFSDVSANTPNQEAILYFQQQGIINGYQDGTFKPKKSVSRAEFLKIIIEGSHIQLDNSDLTPFTDINYKSWYAPYVQKAYSSGWINGYQDDTFKPDQTISKVEALKVLAKAQNWVTTDINTTFLKTVFKDVSTKAWYAPYLSYAKQHQYLDEKGTRFAPNAAMNRGNISGIIYRTLEIKPASNPITNTSNNTTTNPTTSEKEPPPKVAPAPEISLVDNTDTPESTGINSNDFATMDKNSFEKVDLDEDLPNIFYKNEVFVISGSITSGTYESATVILANENDSKDKYFIGKISNNHFDIPVNFKTSGNFKLGLLPGESGQSKAYIIHVNDNLPQSSNTIANDLSPQDSQINYANDQDTVNFSSIPQTIKKLSFNQNGKKVSYISRQDKNNIPISYNDFAGFNTGTVNYEVDIAKLSSGKPLNINSPFVKGTSETFTAVEHSFDENNDKEISATMPDKINSSSTISFTGTAKTDLKLSALVIKPDGNVDKFDLGTDGPTSTYFTQKIIPQNNHFTFTYTPQTTGRYIIEVNNKNSEPSINHPIYVGDVYPLIPDFFDLNEREFFKSTFDLTAERNKLLDLINKSRSEAGLNTIVLDDSLNTLAQNHSEDMKTNNYFGHYDLNNQTPEDRRIKLGITTSVGENLAKDTSTEFVHYGLMRSASHRENILTKDWTRVGLGIALDKEELTVTEEFSTTPLTSNDLNNFKTQLLQDINQKRQEKSVAAITEFSNLNNAAQQMNTSSVNGQKIDNSSFGKALSDNSFFKEAQLFGRNSNTLNATRDSLLNEETALLESKWQLIGLDVQMNKNGTKYTIVILGAAN